MAVKPFNYENISAFQHFSISAFLILGLTLLFSYQTDAQWSPGNLTDYTYRYGPVQIGTNSVPNGILEIHRILPETIGLGGQETLPHLHLSTYQGAIIHPGWDIFSGNTLNFNRDNQNILSMNQNKVAVAPNLLTIGGTNYSLGKNTVSPDGSEAQFISFGLSSSSTAFGASKTGSLIQGASTGDMYFYTKPTSTGAITASKFDEYNKFTIKNDGKIGVGTLNPTQLLTLSTQEDSPVIRLDNQKLTDWEIYTDNGLRFRGGQDGVGTALPDHMVISDQGQVFINVSPTANLVDVSDSDQEYKMYVNGGVACKEVRVRTDWADYVFDKEYEIMPLSKVETYIQANHHLPNMPSAEKVQKQGVELGNVTTKQQEKIEELFLHMIALEKRITQLEKENQILKSKNK